MTDLTTAELERELVVALPARELMTGCGCGGSSNSNSNAQIGLVNVNFQQSPIVLGGLAHTV